MTTLNLVPLAPPDITGLIITPLPTGFDAEWDPVQEERYVEVWINTTNDRATATLHTQTTASEITVTDLSLDTYYIWFRGRNTFGGTGNWNPVSSTAGEEVIVEGVAPALLKLGDSTSTSVSVTTNSSNTFPSSWNTWTDTGTYIDFTPSASSIVAGYAVVVWKITSLSFTGITTAALLQGRWIVENLTDSVELPHLSTYHCFAYAVGSSGGVIINESSPLYSEDIYYKVGYGDDGLIAGKDYRLKFQLLKYRSGTDATFSAGNNGSYLTAAAQDSVTVS